MLIGPSGVRRQLNLMMLSPSLCIITLQTLDYKPHQRFEQSGARETALIEKPGKRGVPEVMDDGHMVGERRPEKSGARQSVVSGDQ
jgi:hypothetical protein